MDIGIVVDPAVQIDENHPVADQLAESANSVDYIINPDDLEFLTSIAGLLWKDLNPEQKRRIISWLISDMIYEGIVNFDYTLICPKACLCPAPRTWDSLQTATLKIAAAQRSRENTWSLKNHQNRKPLNNDRKTGEQYMDDTEIPQPFANFNDLHAWRRANCEGCNSWSCFFHCHIWETMSDSIHANPPLPVPQEILAAAGCTGQKLWPCKAFKNYGYIGFVPGKGQLERICPNCGHHKSRKTFLETCPRVDELMFRGGDKSAKQIIEDTKKNGCHHFIIKLEEP